MENSRVLTNFSTEKIHLFTKFQDHSFVLEFKDEIRELTCLFQFNVLHVHHSVQKFRSQSTAIW